jgi:O-methyltransferase/aklanonic acid methyltransferase
MLAVDHNVEQYAEMKREVIATYHRAAPTYDQVGTRQFTHFARILIKRLAIAPESRVLDVASGRGALLFAAAAGLNADGLAVGIDLAEGMVTEAQRERVARGLNRAAVVRMDADRAAFAPASFDCVLCGFALHFFDYDLALSQFLRLIKPGGVMAASFPTGTVNPGPELERWGWLFKLTKDVFPPDFTPPPAWIAPRRLNKPDKVRAVFAQAGFVDLEIEQHEADLYFRDEADWWAWEWSQGSRFWVEGMRPEARDRFQREAFEHLNAMKEPGGIRMRDAAMFVIARRPR